MSIIQGTSKVAGGGYTINQSARFNDGDSPELSRTYTISAPWTFSVWVKRCEFGAVNILLGTSGSSPEVQFNSGDTITAEGLTTTAVFRDPSSWYHVHVSDNGLYINGVSYGAVTTTNLTNAKLFDDFDGYAAEVHLQSGTSAYTNFGETNGDTGQWMPKAATAGDTYLKFANSSDFGENSGTGGAWSASGLTSADQMLDTPTDNFPTLNPLVPTSNTTLSDGNLVQVVSSAVGRTSRATISIPEGKWVYEYTLVDTNDKNTIWGICREDTTPDELPGTSATSYAFYVTNGNKRNNTAGGGDAYGTSVTTAGKTVQIAVHRNGTSLKIWAGHDQSGSFVWQASGDPAADTNEMYDITINTSDVWFFAGGNDGNFTQTIGPVNFGQAGGFTYTPPTNFIALSTANLDDPTIALPTDYFQTVLDTGANIKATSEALYTDQFEWIKDRDNSNNHQLIDSVRGTSAVLQANLSAAETTYSAPSGNSVGWVWKANGTGSSNTDGSITSTVSANTTAGFSVLTFTGNGTQGATVGHGLGVVPKWIIVKARTTAGPDYGWWMYHAGVASNAEDYHLQFNTAGATDDANAWNDTAPTSSVFSIGGPGGGGAGNFNITGDTLVAYCFADVEGYSKFGSYVGNGSTDGTFVYCGFRPAFVLVKRTNAVSQWSIFDNKREGYNVDNDVLVPNTTATETTTDYLDLLSNGFKARTTDANVNASGGTYIYMAFAESPFKYANAR